MKISILFCLVLFYSQSFAKLDTEWWKHTIIYELIPYSFRDSDGDGIGDLKGIASKLDHFVDLDIETIQLTPHFETTFRDMGYDITDYYKIESGLGTMHDFDNLVKEMKKRKMKLILDLVINHSSHEHEWFQKSINRIDPYTDFYVWKNSKGFDNQTGKEIPPNKWINVFDATRGSGWTWNEKRKQFYFHHFLREQPDFNLTNEVLKNELKKIVKFWLDKGIDGFRLDATPFYFEDKEFRDDEIRLRQFNQPETLEFIHEFRVFLDNYNEENGGVERIFVAEARCKTEIQMQYYGTEDYPITHYPYNYLLEYFVAPPNSSLMKKLLDWWMSKLPEGKFAAWMTQGHDGSRVGSRFTAEYSDIFTMISMMLPGAVGIYYGQEIAMKDGFTIPGQIQDFSTDGLRDCFRLAMQWDDSVNAGFSDNITFTYLPTNSDYFENNVALQKEQRISHYNMFKDLSSLRKTDIFKFGKYTSEAPSSHKSLYILMRSYENNVLAVMVNLHTKYSRVNLTEILHNSSYKITIAAASVNSGYEIGSVLNYESVNGFFMRPLSCVVLKTAYSNFNNKID